MKKQLDILVSGTGVAGPILAYWLHRAGHKVTVLEKDAQIRATGHSIDVREAAVDVIKLMGVEPAVKAKTTSEAGLAFVDANDSIRALFPSIDNDKGQSFTVEYEVLRGELVTIFFEASKDRPNVEYIFSESISSFDMDATSVNVDFTSGRAAHRYDLVIGADGLGSKTRKLAFDASTKDFLRPFDTFAAFFTMDENLLGNDNYCRWYNASGGRNVTLRPDPQGRTRANLCIINHNGPKGYERLSKAFAKGADGIRAILDEEFADAGWKSAAVLEGMHRASDVYGTELAQIRVPQLRKQRVALVGDAGYCPTPLTGMGTSLAIIGAYVLAGEILSNEDVDVALGRYQDVMLPYVRKVQNIPAFAPKIANGNYQWQIDLLLSVLSWVVYLRLTTVASWVGSWLPSGDKFQLPTYQWPAVKK
ncbi:hypothetical protein ANO11243_046520 [Dothideomycetidae sp. 11243]|nr:hypothetical protein ANO11243_046520 [fungal sp. No.11243]